MNTSSHHFVVWPGRLLRASVATIVATIFVLVAACGAPPTPAPPVTLRIGFVRVLDTLPYFVMQEQGLATRNGLKFEEASYQSGFAIIDAMTTNSLDVAYIAYAAVASAGGHGLIPGTVVPVAANSFADPSHPSVGVLAAPSVNSWRDLAKQPIAVVAKTGLTSAVVKRRLQEEGALDYSLVEIPVANMGLAVAGGNVAAATMTEPYLTQSLLRGDGKLLGWVIGGPPAATMETSLIVFSAAAYRNNPQAVKAFLRAHLQAVEWIDQNPNAARSLLARQLGVSEEVGQKMSLLRWPLDARNDPALLDSMQPLLVEIGTLKAPIPARQLYDETLLDQVLAEKP